MAVTFSFTLLPSLSKFVMMKVSGLCQPSLLTDFLTTQILGGHVTRFNQGLSLDDKGGEEREPGSEVELLHAIAWLAWQACSHILGQLGRESEGRYLSACVG